MSEALVRRALILGVSGQDGAYLARFLLDKGYDVHGTSRDAENRVFRSLQRLGVADRVSLHSVSLDDFRNLLQVVTDTEPDEIYNLSGQSAVGLSFSQPMMAFDSIAVAANQLLEVLRYLRRPIKLYNACSSECFGDIKNGMRCDELTPFKPVSPYAVAKASAHWMTSAYREAYGLYACSGILFNHESPLRPERFVTRKIVSTAVAISQGSQERLTLGRLDVRRDWGYAPDYVDAMWRMLQQDQARDYVVATGASYTLEAFVEAVFSRLDLDWREYVDIDAKLYRPSDINHSAADPTRAQVDLNWKASVGFEQLVDLLVASEQTAPARRSDDRQVR